MAAHPRDAAAQSVTFVAPRSVSRSDFTAA